MAEYLPIRAFNRSQNVRIAKNKISATATTYIDVSDTATRKEFSYHSAIGAVYVVGSLTASNEGGVLDGLFVVPTEAESKKVKNELGDIKLLATGEVKHITATEVEIEKTTTKPRIDYVVVKLSNGAVSIVKGTAAESPVAPTLEAGYIAIAKLEIPKEKEKVKAENIIDVRSFV